MPVTLNVTAPDINVTPVSLTESLNPGQSSTQVITIQNVGNDTLNWTMDEVPDELWLTTALVVPAQAGTVPPGDFQEVEATFNATGLAVGTYNTTLEITSDDPDEGLVVVPVTLNVTAPDINVTPVSLTQTLTIGNQGNDTLNWTMAEVTDEL